MENRADFDKRAVPAAAGPAHDGTAQYDRENALLELLKTVTEGKGRPLDSWELTALLETNGLRDIDAVKDWGEPDLFALAERLNEKTHLLSFKEEKKKARKSSIFARAARHYLKGMLFAVPMAIQIIAMIMIGFGIWSSVDFGIRQATVIGLATLMALACTGGMAQVIGRKGLFYIKMEETLLAAKITRILYAAGAAVVLLVALLLSAAQLQFNLFPPFMFELFITYFLLLSFLFIVLAVFYMLEAYASIAFLVILGIVFVYLFHMVLGLKIFTAQYISIFLMIVAANAMAFRSMKKLEKKSKSEGTLLPGAASLFYTLHPYFIYGSLYFIFIIMDRLLAWTTGTRYLPYFVWFNYPYEVGVDWALLPAIFTIALVEVFIYELGISAFTRIGEFPSSEARKFNRHFLRLYLLAGVVFLAVGAGSIALAYAFPFVLARDASLFKFLNSYFNRIHVMVFFFASAGYTFLSWALLNCIIFFSYSRAGFAIKSIAAGTLANFIVGLIASRAFAYYYSVIGLTAGGFVFAAVSTYFCLKFFRRYDYYYYSAY